MADGAEGAACVDGWTSWGPAIEEYLAIPELGLPAGDRFYMADTDEWVVA